MLYFSYAANLNRSHMSRLCPGAEHLFPAILEGYALTVRRWFNVEPEEGARISGGVWRIEPVHLPRLDSYEDSPELYERRMARVIRAEHGSGGAWAPGRNTGIDVSVCRGAGESSKGHERQQSSVECLVYMMKEPFTFPLSLPDPEYLEMVEEGYREWGISSKQLDAALEKLSAV